LNGEPLLLDPKAQLIEMGGVGPAAAAAGGGGGIGGGYYGSSVMSGGAAAAGVLLRDQISRDVGLAPQGYTLQELQVRGVGRLDGLRFDSRRLHGCRMLTGKCDQKMHTTQ
jgi:hypothetical protein